ncbi:MAG: hypothetical protein ABI818_11125 [Acidobacteriota bacterium]
MHGAWMIPAIFSFALSAAPAGQHGTEAGTAEPRKGDPLVVTGCIIGPTIEETDTLRSFRLTGDKAIVKELAKEHAGHIDEVSGTLKSTLASGTTHGRQFGRSRVSIGIVESKSRPAPDRGEALPVLAVKSFRHLPGVCSK